MGLIMKVTQFFFTNALSFETYIILGFRVPFTPRLDWCVADKNDCDKNCVADKNDCDKPLSSRRTRRKCWRRTFRRDGNADDAPSVANIRMFNVSGNIVICRSCASTTCQYQRLYKSCPYSVSSVVFHNKSTLPLAFVITIWAILFLELWKRKQNRLGI